jgi:hypothetical protein
MIARICATVCLLVFSGLSSAATCTSGQQPFSVTVGTATGSGASAAAACTAAAAAKAAQVAATVNGTLTGMSCALGNPAFGPSAYGTGTVSEVCTVETTTPPSTSTGGVTASAVICNGTCTLVLKPGADEVSVTRIVDMGQLTMLFLVAGIAVLCVRKLGELFRVPHERD